MLKLASVALAIMLVAAPAAAEQTQCEALYETWVYLRSVDEVCDYDVEVGTDYGIALKQVCAAELPEQTRQTIGSEAVRKFKEAYSKQPLFCEVRREDYESIAQAFYE